jgi:hypothetical protein
MSAKSESDDQIFIIEEASGGSCYLLSLSGYYIVCRPWNVDACNNGQKSLLTFNYMNETRFRITNANGYFKVENVGGVVYPFCDAPLSAAATWVLEEVTAETGVDEVKIESVKVKGIYDLTGRRIDEITVPGIYIVDGKKVLVK